MIVEVDSEKVEERHVTTQNGEFMVREQKAYLRRPDDRYPQEFVLQLEGSRPAFPVGEYRIKPSAVFIGRFKQLEFKRALELELFSKGQ